MKAVAYTTNNVSSLVNEDYAEMDTYDYSFGERAYDFSDIAIKRDGSDGSGLSKVKEEEGKETYISYKFIASENKEITKIKLTGLARIFDYNGKEAKFVIYTSSDNSNWKALKEYSPNSLTDGTEMVSLDYTKALSEGVSVMYVKVVWDCSSGGSDWVVLKRLEIEMSEASIVPPTSSESSSEAPITSSSEATSSSKTTSSEGGSNKKTDSGKNLGLIIGMSACGAAIVLAGVITAIVVKRKKAAK